MYKWLKINNSNNEDLVIPEVDIICQRDIKQGSLLRLTKFVKGDYVRFIFLTKKCSFQMRLPRGDLCLYEA